LIGLGLHKSEEAVKICKAIHDTLEQTGIDVLFDDRDVSPGIKFNDADLIGLPFQLIVGEKGLQQGQLELKIRKTQERLSIAISLDDTLVSTVVNAIQSQMNIMGQ
jgi:prolyl-tRNA synthetase